ncbi:hypothetical protein LPAF129_03840 [Ligilactobacillus pabuli]|uniref:F0F1 ATP synthase subunit B n=1 Tax=Ligilactobacillus pabuli TaxID=2886039 RepID=A0ABQ5JHU0_9LACO|nr:hypothetical protein [Ligilactobacillus pabuli]GKS80699.1 hypothetical protein LPAF129_03840 [Ligilactobacillus pabuli]
MNWVLIQQIGMTILVVILLIIAVISLWKVVPEINKIVRGAALEEGEKNE